MDKKETVKYREAAMELAAFIKESPTPFHVTANIGVILEKEGFMPLQESRKWEMKAGGKYYVTRNHSSIIAFEIGEDPADYNFQIAASHSDSPTFKVKENAQMEDVYKRQTLRRVLLRHFVQVPRQVREVFP